MQAFFRERVGFYLREVRGQAYDVVAAVIGGEKQGGYAWVRDTVARAEAVSVARGGEDFLAVSAAFKRIKNILAQAKYEPIDSGGFVLRDSGDPESALMKKAYAITEQLGELRKQRAYGAALAAIATIRPEVDAFFEKVMVMDPDLNVRQRRLMFLSTIVTNFSGIADFSEIVTPG
jgi:glycyl-tRNA synthetase beta chain